MVSTAFPLCAWLMSPLNKSCVIILKSRGPLASSGHLVARLLETGAGMASLLRIKWTLSLGGNLLRGWGQISQAVFLGEEVGESYRREPQGEGEIPSCVLSSGQGVLGRNAAWHLGCLGPPSWEVNCIVTAQTAWRPGWAPPPSAFLCCFSCYPRQN